jgi:ankyrin repeat protein
MIATPIEFHKHVAPVAAFPSQLIDHGYSSMEIWILAMLLEAGADVNAQVKDKVVPKMLKAIRHSQGWIITYFAASSSRSRGFYYTALESASQHSHRNVIEMLLGAGADVNMQGGFFNNALQLASCCCHKAIIDMLLLAGADINAQGGFLGNALQAASAYGGLSKERSPSEIRAAVEILLKAGADVNTKGGVFRQRAAGRIDERPRRDCQNTTGSGR